MKTLEELQKENEVLVASLDDHRNFLWHLRDKSNDETIKDFLEESRYIELYLKNLKASTIEKMFYEFENEYTYHSVLPHEVLEYANKLRGNL